MSSNFDDDVRRFFESRRVLEDMLREEFDVAEILRKSFSDLSQEECLVKHWVEESERDTEAPVVSHFWRDREGRFSRADSYYITFLKCSREEALKAARLFDKIGKSRVAGMFYTIARGE